MHFKRIILITNSILLLLVCAVFASQIWQEKTNDIRERRLLSIAMDRSDSSILYIGSDRAVYKTIDRGLHWQEVLGVGGSKKAVNFLLIEPEDKNTIYAATGNGLFRSQDAGKRWQKIFHGTGDLEKECTALSVAGKKIYLGTSNGLFISLDKGKTWHKLHGGLGNTKIINIVISPFDKDAIYLASLDGVYKTSDGESWQRIYVATSTELEESADIDLDRDADETLNEISQIRYLAMDINAKDKIYLATSKDILYSQDRGSSWQKLTSDRPLNQEVQFILVSPLDSKIYAATKSGVFEFNDNKWQELYLGMTIKNVYALSLDVENNLWAVGEGGVFKLMQRDYGQIQQLKQDINQTKRILEYFKDEPTIQQIHQGAIKYAEVDLEKIKSWRRRAQMKALMPELTLDFDRNVVTGMASNYYRAEIGPQDWGVNLKWDFGELIWNDDQTSIDSRSKLMVELRDDILDGVTRLYFERRRLQTELLVSPPKDEAIRLEKELRLEELTASIDALTGGYLSKQLLRIE